MEKWRLLKLNVNDAFTNMAIDEAIATARVDSLVPNTLRFYRWNPSAVSIGRFQDINNEVHIENCRRLNVGIVRRITGGGTVYHDCVGEITYSVVVRETDLAADVVQAYNMIGNGLIEAAEILGVVADFNLGDSRNCPSIAINGKKISGSAQFHRHGVLLQHGTFLLDINLEEMFTFLRVPWAKNTRDVVCVARDRLTSIEKELSRKVSIDDAYEALILGFQKALKIEFREEPLIEQEQNLAKKLQKEKFSKDSWNLTGKTTSKENDKVHTLKNQ